MPLAGHGDRITPNLGENAVFTEHFIPIFLQMYCDGELMYVFSLAAITAMVKSAVEGLAQKTRDDLNVAVGHCGHSRRTTALWHTPTSHFVPEGVHCGPGTVDARVTHLMDLSRLFQTKLGAKPMFHFVDALVTFSIGWCTLHSLMLFCAHCLYPPFQRYTKIVLISRNLEKLPSTRLCVHEATCHCSVAAVNTTTKLPAPCGDHLLTQVV